MDRVIIYTDSDLQLYLQKYNVRSLFELESLLWSTAYIVVEDRRLDSEFSGVNAQSSTEFFEEAVTIDEFEELQNKRSLYE